MLALTDESVTADVDLTDAQVTVLWETVDATLTEMGSLIEMLHTYAAVGGRDWETYERLCDYLARAGMRMVMNGRGVIDPDAQHRATQLLQDAGNDQEVGLLAGWWPWPFW